MSCKVLMLDGDGISLHCKNSSSPDGILFGIENPGRNDMSRIISSESVSIGHPDKTCDTIADAFLDEALRQDPESQMAVECAIKNDRLFVYGEATTKAQIDYDGIAKRILKEIGYKNEFKVIKELSQQSPDIHQAVVKSELMANDQGMVYGYATDETPQFMPLPIMVAHALMRRYDEYRKTTDFFYADAKSQVSVDYGNGIDPKHIETILVSASHSEKLESGQISNLICRNVIEPVMTEYSGYADGRTGIKVNPSGKFTIWGSFGDSGCVGRKIVVDTYGGIGRVGGGCFSSKNATKVDRSAAYYARYVARNIVSHHLARRCEIQLAYAIGEAEPVSIYYELFGTELVPVEKIKEYVAANFCFRPSSIIDELGLKKPIYQQTACYGHFGRSEFPWERDK